MEGFAGTEKKVDERQKGDLAWIFKTPTILDATHSIASIYKGSGSKTGAVINGCTLCNSDGGAAIIFRGGEKAENCIIENNAGNKGGGIMIYGGGIVRNCLIKNNTAVSGGAIGFLKSNSALSLIENCIITQNTVNEGGYGSAIYMETSPKALVRNCLLYGHIGTAAIFVKDGSSTFGGGGTLCNVTVAETKVKGYYSKQSYYAPYIYNSVFWGENVEDSVSCEVSNIAGCPIYISNSGMMNWGTDAWKENNLYVNSFKVEGDNDGGVDTLNYVRFSNPAVFDFSLTENSCLVDKGIDSIVAGIELTADIFPTTDLFGIARPQGRGIDIGCFESSFGSALKQITDSEQFAKLVFHNGNLEISEIQKPTTIMIYDVEGKLVQKTMVLKNHVFNLSAGLYIVHLQQGNKVQTQKVFGI